MSITSSIPSRRPRAIDGENSAAPLQNGVDRCLYVESAIGAEAIIPSPAAKLSPADALREAIYFSRPGGGACFDDGDNAAAEAVLRVADMQRAVSELAKRDDSAAAELRQLLRRSLRRDGRPTTERKGFPRPAAAYHREASRRTVMRTDWSPEAAQLAVDWSQPEMRCELAVGDDIVFAGRSVPTVRVAGRLAEPTTDWEEVCWESNVDCDYLELELALTGGARLQRQFVLSRRDGLLFTADAVLLRSPAEVECEFALPFAGDVRAAPADETTEAVLSVGKRRLLLLPLGLNEWRCDARHGELRLEDGRAVVRQSAADARALYVPAAIAFGSRQARQDRTWRRLTVGEHLELMPADRACGVRLQLGRQHWLAYRSLTPRANRTVLGVNLQSNFLLARFTRDGVHEPLVEIDE